MAGSSEERQRERNVLLDEVNKAEVEYFDALSRAEAARRTECDLKNIADQKGRALIAVQAKLRDLLNDPRI